MFYISSIERNSMINMLDEFRKKLTETSSATAEAVSVSEAFSVPEPPRFSPTMRTTADSTLPYMELNEKGGWVSYNEYFTAIRIAKEEIARLQRKIDQEL
jgi:hypothetical protein